MAMAGRFSQFVLLIGLSLALMGCAGGYDGGYYSTGYYGPAPVVEPEPDVVLFGGDYDRRDDVLRFSQRGYESRHAQAHGGDFHRDGHDGGHR